MEFSTSFQLGSSFLRSIEALLLSSKIKTTKSHRHESHSLFQLCAKLQTIVHAFTNTIERTVFHQRRDRYYVSYTHTFKLFTLYNKCVNIDREDVRRSTVWRSRLATTKSGSAYHRREIKHTWQISIRASRRAAQDWMLYCIYRNQSDYFQRRRFSRVSSRTRSRGDQAENPPFETSSRGSIISTSTLSDTLGFSSLFNFTFNAFVECRGQLTGRVIFSNDLDV